MSGASIARRVAAIIGEHGEAMTLRRAGTTDITVKGKRYGVSDADLVGSMADAAFTIRIADAEIAASGDPRAPRRGDTIGGYVVISVDSRKDGDEVVVHMLAVGGGQ